MSRHIRALALATLTALLAGCGPDAAPTPSPTPQPTVIRHWLNQPCPHEGATAVTISGGHLICAQVGSDPAPEWHAVTPAASQANQGGQP